MLNSSRPLDIFPFIRSRKIEEAREAYANIYGKPTITSARGVKLLDVSINACQLQDTGLYYGAYGAAVHLEFPESNFFVQFFPTRGKGALISDKASASLTAGATVAVSSNMSYQANYDADYEHFFLKIDGQALTRKLTAMTGGTVSEPLRLELQQDPTSLAAKMLHQYIPLLADTLSGAHPPFPDWWIVQTEQFLMTLFLSGNRHNYSHLLEQCALDAAPWQVRRAEEYIEANWQQFITLEDLAALTGMSEFGLFRSFKWHRGYSPLEFIAQMRSRRGGIH